MFCTGVTTSRYFSVSFAFVSITVVGHKLLAGGTDLLFQVLNLIVAKPYYVYKEIGPKGI